jgi:hypothetical protein
MSTRDERLEGAFREAYERGPVPEFEAVWREAASRAREKKQGTLWRWALGPALASVSAAVIALAVYGPGAGRRGDDAGAVRAPEKALVAIADAGAGAAAEGNEAVAAESSSEPEGMYVAGTDFLLDVNLPAWN